MTEPRIAPLDPPYDDATQKLFDMVMPDGGGASLLMSGTVDEHDKVTGKFDIGGRPELQDQAMYPAVVLPFMGAKLDNSREVTDQ